MAGKIGKPLAECHICGCSWITDVGGFNPDWQEIIR